MKSNYIGQAWLVIVLSLCFGAALAGVQTALNPRIQANKEADTIGQIPKLVPGAVGGERKVFGDHVVYVATDDKNQQVGWVIMAIGQGFADRIELLVGVDREVTKITGLYILDQKETPGLGNRVSEDGWRGQFKDKPLAGKLVVTKSKPQMPEEIEAVTGATISSDSVVGIVNAAVARFRDELKRQGSS